MNPLLLLLLLQHIAVVCIYLSWYQTFSKAVNSERVIDIVHSSLPYLDRDDDGGGLFAQPSVQRHAHGSGRMSVRGRSS